VHSFETWVGGELVGGLYGIALGHMFFGESMFARANDASKIALAALVAFCRRNVIATIDCQQRTAHLASFGGRELPRREFEQRLSSGVDDDTPIDWTYDLSMWTSIGIALPERAGDPAARGPA
ncbi:MAG: leucyl/phenylalanyl-tRNA--protein transferase, partial [Pseudomonadota bacterium]|nr:leucyl/phenylalanyl-tRNA--protein transferase [Pseudomonadota bacterium]